MFLSALLFAISASLDAFIVGITYGIRRIHLPLPHNLLISLVTLAGTVSAILLGQALAPMLPPGAASLAGSGLLLGMGLYYLGKDIRKLFGGKMRKKHSNKNDKRNDIRNETVELPPEAQAAEGPSLLSLRQLFLLGAALSFNNMGIGVGASIAGLPLFPAAVLTLLCSVGLLALGNMLGKSRLLQIAGRFCDPLSGLLLILLGICGLM